MLRRSLSARQYRSLGGGGNWQSGGGGGHPKQRRGPK